MMRGWLRGLQRKARFARLRAVSAMLQLPVDDYCSFRQIIKKRHVAVRGEAGRYEKASLDLFEGSLTCRVKVSDGIDLITQELDSQGFIEDGGKMSMIAPRFAKSPCSRTSDVNSYPADSRNVVRSSCSSVSPNATSRLPRVSCSGGKAGGRELPPGRDR